MGYMALALNGNINIQVLAVVPDDILMTSAPINDTPSSFDEQ